MKFSVIIPTFNRVPQTIRAIRSVLQQTYNQIEIIVVDDGSTNENQHLLRQEVAQLNTKNKVFVYFHSENRNGAAARNTGILKASGDYICFLDSDDEWKNNKLATLHQHIADAVPPPEFIHHQYVNVVNDNPMCEATPRCAKPSNMSVAEYSFVLNDVGGIQSSTICVIAKLAKRVKFNPALKGHQDWDFALRCGAECKDFTFIEACLTLRHFDSADSVASSLDSAYSYQFLKQYSEYISGLSRHFFFLRVVMRKAVLANKGWSLLMYSQMWKTLLAHPWLFTQLVQSKKSTDKNIERRVRAIEEKLRTNNISTVILWGANHYSRLLIGTLKHTQCAYVIDEGKSQSLDMFEKVPVISLRRIPTEMVAANTAIILATDKHVESMQRAFNHHFSCAVERPLLIAF